MPRRYLAGMNAAVEIRLIRPEDNTVLAGIIRKTLEEFGANHPGTVYFDPTTDALYELFRQPQSHYFVALLHGKQVGGAGIFPTAGLPPLVCELVKMYLLPEARGAGLGTALIEMCLDQARKEGFEKVYLESMPELKKALRIYERLGFRYLSAPMGNSGHFGCDRWMLIDV